MVSLHLKHKKRAIGQERFLIDFKIIQLADQRRLPLGWGADEPNTKMGQYLEPSQVVSEPWVTTAVLLCLSCGICFTSGII